MTVIQSRQNPLIKQLRRLQQRKYRRREGLFVVEGIRPVLAALENEWPVQQIIVCEERLTSNAGREAVARAAAEGVPVAYVAPAVLDVVASWDKGVGLMAIVAARVAPLSGWPVLAQAIYLAVEAPGDPGNVGTMLRTVDAVGGQGLILLGGGTDPFHPGAVRASMGALFTIPVAQVAGIQDLLAWANAQEMPIWATSAQGEQSFWEASWPQRLIVLLGNEQRGLAPATLAGLDKTMRIPMHGKATSLNLAIAASLLLYEYRRRWDPSEVPDLGKKS